MGDNGLELFFKLFVKKIRQDKDITLEEVEQENDYWADVQAETTEATIWN